VRVRVADGPPQRIRDKGQQHLPGGEAWLIGEHRMSGEKKYYLVNLPANTDLRSLSLAATIKARWICEQAHQQMKEELGLDHFEGRSWQGLHRHALMTMIAYAFLQHRRLAATAPKKRTNEPRLSQLCPPCATPFSNFSLDYRRSDARIVENRFAASSGVSKSAKAQNIAPRARPRVTVKFADGPCGKATPQQNSSALQVQTLMLRLNGVRPGANERMGCNRLGYPAECGTH
jgi:hypothetical protein